jgi:hypothetical protein
MATTRELLDVLLTGGEQMNKHLNNDNGNGNGGVAMTLLPTRDDVIKLEPSLASVAHKLEGGLFSDADTNGDIHQFVLRLSEWLTKNYVCS